LTRFAAAGAGDILNVPPATLLPTAVPVNSYFVSDLHLFSRRSQADRYRDQLHATAREADCFVLGGDIFDFRWSTLGSCSLTIDAAIRWLEEIIAPHPNCQFHFVLGNHDCNRNFVARLDKLASATPNLTWYEDYVRLGHSLFLHGDVADGNLTTATLAQRRQKWHHDERRRGAMKNMLYDMVVHAQLHRMVGHLANPQAKVAARILGYLEDIGHGPKNGLRHIYFGHTHVAMTNFQFGGLTFHNGGAPIKGLEFRIIKTDVAAG
jgi:UDP-2,3-diacylglucosamine pyrophosphatase LpxH